MDLNFYSDLTGGTGPHDVDPEFLDPQSFNGFDTDNKFPGGTDNFLTISGSSHPFLSASETFHTPSLGDEEFEIPPISLDPDSALTVSDVVSQFGELSDPGHSDGVLVPGNVVVEGEDPSFASTFVNTPSQGLEHLSLGVINHPGGALLGSSLGMDLGHPLSSQFSGSTPVTIDVPLGDIGQGLLGSSQLTTIDQSELSAQLGLGLGGGNILHGPQSPGNPLSATSSPRGSLQDDDMEDFRRSVLVESPVSQAFSPGVDPFDPSLADSPMSAPSQGICSAPETILDEGNAKKEPKKPVSAYALFFKDTQAAIKGQNANATFGEVSKIVASMWDSLGEEQKQVYKRKNEAAKREYLKALSEYRSSHNSQVPIEVMDTAPSPPPPPPPAPPVMTTPARPLRSQHYNPEENTITNICTSNIILDLPQVTTRSKTRPAKPQLAAATQPTVAKIIIKQMQLPSGAVTVTATQASSSPRQPPPLQQMHNTPPPPRLQQMVHAQTLPPLRAKPRGGGAIAATAPPPLKINVARSSWQTDSSASILVTAGETPTSVSSSPLTVSVGHLASVVTGEDEEGMEVEVNVGPAASLICVRAGCKNPAIESKDWDREYCSNECVATHCRDIFMAWCAIRGQNSTTVT